MSWLSKLFETYEAGSRLDLPEDQKLMPISHTPQNAHINIVIDEQGFFKRAMVLNKKQIILPATESSASRSSNEAPHALADKIQYVAKDYPDYGGQKSSYFNSYEKQLAEWCNSSYAHKKAVAVYKYISKGNLIKDLIENRIIFINDYGMLMRFWPHEEDKEHPVPEIFKVLPPVPKGKRVQLDRVEVEIGDALICWTVELPQELNSQTWDDSSLHQSWIEYYALRDAQIGFCCVAGAEKPLSVNHPAKLRHTGDKAKLLSANDSSGFTFRGRFTNSLQAAGVSFEIAQKAHNALRWLISRQGHRNGDQIFVAWAVTGNPVPSPMEDSRTLMNAFPSLKVQPGPLFVEEDEEEKGVEQSVIDYGRDLGQSFAEQFNKYLAGYRSRFKLNDQIVVMGIDSATPGRMGIIYYRELLESEFFKRIEDWHTQFSWFQRVTIKVPQRTAARKLISKIIWPVSAPVPSSIADTAYGDILKTNSTLRKNLLERIVPCIVDGQPFPHDILQLAVKRTSNRANCEHWEWERNLGITCALYRGFYQRHPTHAKRRNYLMSLDENYKSRDYLYGRLLAIAERIEEIALHTADEKRPTNAARLMQRFADRPFSTWRTIELSLQPYMQRLQGKRDGFLTNRKKELDVVISSFTNDEFSDDKSLTGEFLMGYHCQRMTYKNAAPEKTDETPIQSEESK